MKLQYKIETMMFVGYHPTIDYRIFDLVKERRLLRKDVEVVENEC
jgi:hypothetical protein